MVVEPVCSGHDIGWIACSMLVALEVASEEDALDVSSRALTFASGVMMIH